MSLLDKIKIAAKSTDGASETTIDEISSKKFEEIIKTLSGKTEGSTKKVVDNNIVFTSVSGGTGTSTLVANIAHSMADRGLKVCILDMNILYPVQYAYFGKEQTVIENDLISVLTGKAELGECLHTKGNKSLLYANNRGLYEYLACESKAVTANYVALLSRLRSLYDVVLIDCPMRIENMLVNTCLYEADKLYVVWDESLGSVANTERARKLMRYTGVDSYNKMEIILNKRTSVPYTMHPFKELEIELLGVVPYDSAIIDCGLSSEVFVDKGSSSSRNANVFYTKINEIADAIIKNGGLI